jgi:hypothetical protein
MPGFVSPLLFPFQVFNRCSGCRLPGSHSGRRWTHQRWDISLRWPEFIEQPGRSNSWMREVAILSHLENMGKWSSEVFWGKLLLVIVEFPFMMVGWK